MKRFSSILALALAAFGQQAAPPAFEVASVKVSDPNPQQTVMAGGRGVAVSRMRGCRKPDPGMVNCTNAPLKMLLAQAYEMKNYQIEGPSWIESDGYDLMAKIPAGTPVEKVPAMLQALLAERFKVVVHKETRSLPVYDLTVGKGGPKLKEVPPEEVAAGKAAMEAAQSGRGQPPALPRPGAAGGAVPVGAMMIRISSNGARTLRTKMGMTEFANMLTNDLGRPVFDKTDLKGTYEIELTYLADENDSLQRQIRAQIGDSSQSQTDANTPIATLTQAVQQTLGLKLESRKGQVEILVIDSANKVPTEN